MNYSSIQIVFQEVPGEISICFSICGCNLHCKGCHSPVLWKEESGKTLTQDIFIKTLMKFKKQASCVLFMGGEWHERELINYLDYAQKEGYKTCLYTGENQISEKILKHLTWLKTGKWVEKLGGLGVQTTNQKFIEVQSKKLLNHLFKKL